MIDRIVQGMRDGAGRVLALPRVATAALSGAAGLALLATAPRAASASTPFYDVCLASVDAAAQQCFDDAPYWYDVVCAWTGGVAIILCALGEAIAKIVEAVI